MLKNDLHNALSDMEAMAKILNIEPFELYLLGGSGCVLAEYVDRSTRDFDIIDLEYNAKLGRVLKILEPYDMIDERMATIAPSILLADEVINRYDLIENAKKIFSDNLLKILNAVGD